MNICIFRFLVFFCFVLIMVACQNRLYKCGRKKGFLVFYMCRLFACFSFDSITRYHLKYGHVPTISTIYDRNATFDQLHYIYIHQLVIHTNVTTIMYGFISIENILSYKEFVLTHTIWLP